MSKEKLTPAQQSGIGGMKGPIRFIDQYEERKARDEAGLVVLAQIYNHRCKHGINTNVQECLECTNQ